MVEGALLEERRKAGRQQQAVALRSGTSRLSARCRIISGRRRASGFDELRWRVEISARRPDQAGSGGGAGANADLFSDGSELRLHGTE